MGSGEEEPPPDATMLMGDEVLQGKEMKQLGWSLLNVCMYFLLLHH